MSLQSRLAELESRLQASASGSTPSVAMSQQGDSNSSASLLSARGPMWLPASMNRFPSAIFLDIDCFKWAQLPIPRPNLEVPPEVVEILSGPNAVQDAITDYFSSVHHWFPFISRKRMVIGISLWEGGPDLAMLFLSMLLITTQEITDVEGALANPLYGASKRFLTLLEGSGTLSLIHLQSMILVALYEFGHGIYPAAWMSIGQCSRYIDIIGIPSFKDSSVMLGSCATWTEVEERRRVWWAVYILDRSISLGSKRRFSLPEPEPNHLLPVDDKAWDDGDPSRGLSAPIATPLITQQGAFARLAQSAMLVSTVVTHCRTSIMHYRTHAIPPPFDFGSVTSLADTLSSFARTVRDELPKGPNDSCIPPATPLPTPPSTSTESPDNVDNAGCMILYFSTLSPRLLALSGLILLLDAHACPENLRDGPGPGGMDAQPKTSDELAMQVRAISGLRETSFLIRDIGLELLEAAMLPTAQARVSPLCLDALYGSVATLHWLWKEGGEETVHAAMGDVMRCLARVGMRWKLADEYLSLVHHHDVTTSMALRGVQP
ncbi:hypothetical protein OQA88_1539 [Cercophora sp. LCS_1]